jgi:hypothetical protein
LKPVIVTFGFSFIVGLTALFTTEAQAQCPPPTGYKSIGGTCYRVKGVEATVETTKVGNPATQKKSVQCTIFPEPEPGETQTLGVLFCGNKGGNQPPGQRLVLVPQGLGILTSDQVPINKLDSSKNGGTAVVSCIAGKPEEYSAFDHLCSPGQSAFDFVPCAFNSKIKYTDDSKNTTIEAVGHHCVLPSCNTLTWDRRLGRPEPRAYDCPDETKFVPAD